MIVSTVAGRIRIRSNLLKQKDFAKDVQGQAKRIPGVSEVRVNPAAGSLVVSYDPQLANTEALEGELEALSFRRPVVRQPANGELARQFNRATKIGMVISLGTAVALGFMGRKRAHIGFGMAFLSLASLHIWRNQRTLLR